MAELIRRYCESFFDTVVDLVRNSLKLVPQSKIECQTRADVPIVLDEQIVLREPEADRAPGRRIGAERLQESRGSAKSGNIGSAKPPVISSKWAECILAASGTDIAVTKYYQRPAIPVRKAVELRVADVEAGLGDVTLEDRRAEITYLIGVVHSPLGEVVHVHTDRTERQDRQLTDRTRHSKGPEVSK